MKQSKISALGIDLGTTNSAAAMIAWDPASGAPPVVRVLEIEQPTREGTYSSPLVPSVVAALPDGPILVGEGAKRLRAFLTDYGLSFEKNLFYDTKNEMGLRKTYYRAPDDLNHASKIGGKILEFIAGEAARLGAVGASSGEGRPPVAVTVPASFQLNQRRDTLQAARFAGLSLADDDLLDEPTAALIDFLASAPQPFEAPEGRPALCVVFDFGGGTCDVSVVEISKHAGEAELPRLLPSLSDLTMSHLAVSRYHRLGGGDIDAAIVHEILIPRLLAENDLGPLDIAFAQKKKGLEPQLLGKAEALKIAISSEINRLIAFGRYGESTDKAAVVVKQPSVSCKLGEAVYRLTDTSISAADFERILAPFLDTDFLFARTTEYRLTQSIFAPLRDAMDRAGRSAEAVDLCLMVGGSSLIPQVRDALRNFFPNARVVFHDGGLEAKLCVAKGAAWNAAFKALAGRPLIRPVLHDGIALVKTDGKLNSLIPPGVGLPFPNDGTYLPETLVVPPSQSLPVKQLRFEIVGERDRQHIFDEIWSLPEGVKPGDKIEFKYRMTAGKQLDCRAHLADRPGVQLEMTIDNPLVNVANPGAVQIEIEKLEEDLRQRQGGTARDRDMYVELARKYAKLNQREKALDYLRIAQSRSPRPDASILNLQGIYFSELGDHQRAETAYLEAFKAEPRWRGPLFNLSILYRKLGRYEEALETVDKAIQVEEDPGPYLGLKALILDSLGRPEESLATAARALAAFGPPAIQEDWSLGWLITTAGIAGNDDIKKRAQAEQVKRRRQGKEQPSREHILRPDVMGDESFGRPGKTPRGRKGRPS